MAIAVKPPRGISLALEKVEVSYGGGAVLRDFSLSVAPGEFFGLIGPSGCGKSTTLGVIAGLVETSSGRVMLDARDVTQLPPQRREIGVVFQNYALFPHMTVSENVGYGLTVGRKPADYDERVARLLSLVKLGDKGGRYPKELSGGEQQRVAIARALAIDPQVLLLDEPLSNLDAKLREEMQVELKHIQREAGVTTIFVTHDQDEAFAICDRVGLMNKGQLEQVGTAREIYRKPGSHFVARFIGKSNMLPATAAMQDGQTVLLIGGMAVRSNEPLAPGQNYALYLRPEELSIRTRPDAGDNTVDGVVEAVTEVGPNLHHKVTTPIGTLQITTSSQQDVRLPVGARAYVVWAISAGSVLHVH